MYINNFPLFASAESGPSVKKEPRRALLAKEPACGADTGGEYVSQSGSLIFAIASSTSAVVISWSGRLPSKYFSYAEMSKWP